MTLSPTRRRAEELARLLDTGGRTDDPTLAPLVSLAEALQSVPAGPRPEFRDALRQRLVAVAAVRTAPEPAPTAGERVRDWAGNWRIQRRFAAAVAGVAALVVVGGVGVGASRSLPGEPLYGVKRVAERIQLATASGDYGKGVRHLEFARTRLAEVDALAARSSMSRSTTTNVVDALRDMNADTVTGTNDLTRAYAEGKPAAQRLLTTFAHDQRQELVAVLPSLPPPARAVAATSLALLGEVDHQAAVLAKARCAGGTCTTAVTGAQTPTGTTTGPAGGSVTPSTAPGVTVPGLQSPQPGVGGLVTATPQPSASASAGPGLPSAGITTSTTPLPGVTLSPLPLPVVTLPSLTDTVTSLLSPSPAPSPTASSTTLLPLPLPTLNLLGG